MAVYIRLTDAVRARLRGGDSAFGSTSSSGSDHDASACLSGLVQAFLETEDAAAAAADNDAPQQGGDDCDSDEGDSAAASVRDLLDPPAEQDVFRIRLAAAASAAAEAEAALRSHGAAFRRAMARRLRAAGYDSGVCRSRWEASGGVTAGTYEYVDVVVAAAASPSNTRKATRYIVDADFRAGMEVARATAEYAAVVAAVPAACVVAREENVGRAVLVASNAARRSLRAQGLHVPPWRKTRYMLAKWLGPYKRSTAAAAAMSSVPNGGGGAGMDVVKCRAVGFFAPPAAAPAARIK
ncbi:hypothetical protein PR202_gb03964 [Eleusine coracana subsp. coracana]|uniref:Uncharacterized protein n=1 Tax=Eleusine coracana subsp. coracana TaxID=191504 RepID=A0AAV5E3B9_ELECO|nr:hypothetical protein QOZ80_1BG0094280 [Eleusine coracana subsp. coracana]GJN16935.1 hypothetical protein PR202_gb03964 [Eleusine coracana subsp. coracana]